jgi:hypothetical protein
MAAIFARRMMAARRPIVEMIEQTEPPADPTKSRDWFIRAKTKFERTLERGKRISSATDNRFVDDRRSWASWVFLKLCVAGDTLSAISMSIPDEGNPALDRTLDHWSTAAMARNMIEAAVMFAYLSDRMEKRGAGKGFQEAHE